MPANILCKFPIHHLFAWEVAIRYLILHYVCTFIFWVSCCPKGFLQNQKALTNKKQLYIYTIKEIIDPLCKSSQTTSHILQGQAVGSVPYFCAPNISCFEPLAGQVLDHSTTGWSPRCLARAAETNNSFSTWDQKEVAVTGTSCQRTLQFSSDCAAVCPREESVHNGRAEIVIFSFGHLLDLTVYSSVHSVLCSCLSHTCRGNHGRSWIPSNRVLNTPWLILRR